MNQDIETIKLIKDFIVNFTSIFWEAMPFIVLGAVLAGILEEMVPQQAITRVLPRSRFLGILIGGLLGIIFPMCECGIIPIMRRLLRKGLPLSCCTAYLLAGPIVNPVVMLSTYYAFEGQETHVTSTGQLLDVQTGWLMLVLRVGVGYLIAVGTSLIVERLHARYGNSLLTPLAQPSSLPLVEEENGNGKKKPLLQRLGNISETALHDYIDITVFLILGALLASFVRLFLTHERIAELAGSHVILTILIMMGLAILLCLCSEADAFVAASFRKMPFAAKLSFLTLGPMLDLKLYMMYTRVFRPRLIYTIFGSVIVQAFIYSYVVNFTLEHYGDIRRLFGGD